MGGSNETGAMAKLGNSFLTKHIYVYIFFNTLIQYLVLHVTEIMGVDTASFMS